MTFPAQKIFSNTKFFMTFLTQKIVLNTKFFVLRAFFQLRKFFISPNFFVLLLDLALSDYYLFPNLKKWLGRRRFLNNDKVIAAVDRYFEDLDASSYAASIKKFLQRWTMCDALQEKVTYVGKHNFAVKRKIADDLENIKFQVLIDKCSRYV